MTDVYLCRHGRTQMNVAGLLRGRLDPDLDLVGHAEARDLARQLDGVGLARVISSPLARAVETARPIAEASQVQLETDERLADRAYGAFDGHPSAEVEQAYGSLDDAPGVEAAEAVAARSQAVLDDLVSAGETGPVAIVSHDAVIRILLDRLTPTPRKTHHVQPRTGCWSLLRRDEAGWHLLAANSKDDPVETALASRPLHNEQVFPLDPTSAASPERP